jgi:hypothetical protein
VLVHGLDVWRRAPIHIPLVSGHLIGLTWGWKWRWCMKIGWVAATPPQLHVSFDTNGDRHAEAGHLVERVTSDLGFGPLIGQSPVETPTDDGLVSIHRGFGVVHFWPFLDNRRSRESGRPLRVGSRSTGLRCGGGRSASRFRRAGFAAVRGPAGRASVDGFRRSSIPAGSCRRARPAGCV